MTELMTPAEHEAMNKLGELWKLFVNDIVDQGAAENADRSEILYHVHALQRTVMAQAAARAYPELYRPLGGDPMPDADDKLDVDLEHNKIAMSAGEQRKDHACIVPLNQNWIDAGNLKVPFICSTCNQGWQIFNGSRLGPQWIKVHTRVISEEEPEKTEINPNDIYECNGWHNNLPTASRWVRDYGQDVHYPCPCGRVFKIFKLGTGAMATFNWKQIEGTGPDVK